MKMNGLLLISATIYLFASCSSDPEPQAPEKKVPEQPVANQISEQSLHEQARHVLSEPEKLLVRAFRREATALLNVLNAKGYDDFDLQKEQYYLAHEALYELPNPNDEGSSHNLQELIRATGNASNQFMLDCLTYRSDMHGEHWRLSMSKAFDSHSELDKLCLMLLKDQANRFTTDQ